MNVWKFANNTVYSSPHIRTIETLCYMLESHPQRHELTVVLVPLAKEVMMGYDNIPLPVTELAERCIGF